MNPFTETALQAPNLVFEPGDVVQFVAGQLGDQPLLGREPLSQLVASFLDSPVPRGGVAGVEVVDADQQPVDRGGALVDQGFPAVD